MMILTKNRFGSYAPPPAKAIDEVGKSCSWPQEPPETGCMILIVASKNFKSARILAQDQTGRSILSYPGRYGSPFTVKYYNWCFYP